MLTASPPSLGWYQNVTGESLPDATQAYPKFKELHIKATGGGPTDLPLKASAREAWRDLYGAIQSFQVKHGNKTLSDGTLFLEIESLECAEAGFCFAKPCLECAEGRLTFKLSDLADLEARFEFTKGHLG